MLVVALLLGATVAFGIGIAVEKAEEGEAGHTEETLLGIELESTPLVLAGVIASLILGFALWRYGRRRWLLGLTAIFCLGFAVLDGIEASRKWGDEVTIAGLAIAAMALHAAAAARWLRCSPAAAVPVMLSPTPRPKPHALSQGAGCARRRSPDARGDASRRATRAQERAWTARIGRERVPCRSHGLMCRTVFSD